MCKILKFFTLIKGIYNYIVYKVKIKNILFSIMFTAYTKIFLTKYGKTLIKPQSKYLHSMTSDNVNNDLRATPALPRMQARRQIGAQRTKRFPPMEGI
ncbi:MAG: hypothetical protein CL561_05795 [Alphaproteobacteria bacterium]|jgi:hypothetical protein|nr:hypothetical protein [Alphaproteobacteria bacterium]|tara:strand:+ start:321102 stop:321395 length:294 start_codon:yes stop_codon:yes gene_type:complete